MQFLIAEVCMYISIMPPMTRRTTVSKLIKPKPYIYEQYLSNYIVIKYHLYWIMSVECTTLYYKVNVIIKWYSKVFDIGY